LALLATTLQQRILQEGVRGLREVTIVTQV
jgi:hypothetical protein